MHLVLTEYMQQDEQQELKIAFMMAEEIRDGYSNKVPCSEVF